jgi:fructokinase
MDRIGIDLGGTKIEALRLDAQGAERWRRRVSTPAGDYAGTVQAVVALAREALAAAPDAASIGIGTPGALATDGRMKNCNSTCLNGQPLHADLQQALGRPVALANDADCLALSEATDGAGAGAAVVFAAILGTGVGAGIAVRGRVLQGPNGLAGEWGHNPLPWADAGDPVLACYCGQRGCIETLLSGPGLARDHARHGPDGRQASGTGPVREARRASAEGSRTVRPVAASSAAEPSGRIDPDPQGRPLLDAKAIAAGAAAGDTACIASLERHADRLARALAGVINLLDPDVIVLGGGLSHLNALYETVPRRWSRWVFAGGVTTPEPVRTRLRPALHGDASGVRGAAWLGGTLAGG